MLEKLVMKKATLIDDLKSLETVVKTIEKESLIGIDTESDSFFSYNEKICVLQIATREEDYIVDPLKIKDLSPLQPVFENRRIEKIFHDCSNDITGLKADFGFQTRNIFDTAIAWRMISGKHRGLAYLLELHFGFHCEKKYQKWDWRRRPLSPKQLSYAQSDIHYLIPLRDILYNKLLEEGLLGNFAKARKTLELLERSPRKFNPNGFWRLKGSRDLDPESLQVLKAVFRYRERLAQKLNKAPFRVINGEALVRLARRKPENVEEVLKCKGLPRYLKKQRAKELVQVINKAIKSIHRYDNEYISDKHSMVKNR